MLQHLTKFGAVGIINTLLDFGLFNIFTSKAVRWSKIVANLASTSIAMVVSFILNRGFVFQATSGDPTIQALEFFAVTAFGLYVIQNAIIYVLLRVWHWPLNLGWRIAQALRVSRLMSQEVFNRNAAKLVATAASLTWNYVLFEFIVFRVHP